VLQHFAGTHFLQLQCKNEWDSEVKQKQRKDCTKEGKKIGKSKARNGEEAIKHYLGQWKWGAGKCL
jgi:hypothetical protein